MSQSGNHEADHENLLAWSSLDRALDPASRDILIGTCIHLQICARMKVHIENQTGLPIVESRRKAS